jgi:hypothetical protein
MADIPYTVNTIRHTAEDDAELTKFMETSWRSRGKMSQEVDSLGPYRLRSTAWPVESGSYLYVLDGDRVVGFANLRYAPNDTLYLSPIFFREEVRGQNLGLTLYRFLIDNNVALRPDTDQTLAAQGLWAKLIALYPSFEDGRGLYIASQYNPRPSPEESYERLTELAEAARPINDADWGSERHMAAETAFVKQFRRIVGQTPDFDRWCDTATTDEMIDEGLRLVAEYLRVPQNTFGPGRR